ncbi:MAG: WD40 repeat domain-containing protein [Anaerolineae bacterium]|nr:WD40 repeat domain-containing protein [Anaerolineae bacterium]
MKSKLLPLICTLILSLVVVPPTSSSPSRQSSERVRITPENALEINPLMIFEDHAAPVFEIVFAPENDPLLMAAHSKDNTAKLWDISTGDESYFAEILKLDEGAYPIAFGLHESPVSFAYGFGNIILTNSALPELKGHQGKIQKLTFVPPDGNLLASSSEDGTVRIWDVQNVTELVILRGFEGASQILSFSPDGSILAASNRSADDSINEIRFWKVNTQSNQQIVVPGQPPLAFSPDSSLVAFVSDDSSVEVKLIDKVIREETGSTIAVLEGHTDLIRDLAFHPDGLMIATASGDKTISLWNAVTGEEYAVLLGHTDTVHSIAFSPDGRLLASASLDGTIRLWDTQTFEELTVLHGHTGSSIFVTFSPDGTLLASAGGEDNDVIIWGVGPAIQLPGITSVPPQSTLVRINNYEAICANPVAGGSWPTGNLPYTAYPPDDLPAEVQSTLETGIDVIICHAYSTLRIENCHYLGPGNYSYIYIRYRTDDTVQLVNYETGQVITQRKFEGADPPACPDEIIRGEIYGDPPTPDQWLFWVLDELYQR